MDINFQIKGLASTGSESTWLNNSPVKRQRTNSGDYGFCPWCDFKGRSLLIGQDSVFCSKCDMDATWLELAKHLIEVKQFPFSLIKASDSNGDRTAGVMRDVVNYYRFNLAYHDRDLSLKNYLTNRKISLESVKSFQLGLAPGRDISLKEAFTTRTSRKVLREQSLLVTNEGRTSEYDRFTSRLMFPISNEQGAIISFGGRVFLGESKGAKYLNGAETSLFQKSSELYGLYQAKPQIVKENVAVVVEGYLDVISLHQHGIKTAVATMGTALTEQHATKLFSLCDYVYLCFDSDKAGTKAARSAIAILTSSMEGKGKRIFVTCLSPGSDPDSIVSAGGAEAFKKQLAQSLTPISFILKTASTSLDLDNTHDLARFIEDISPFYRSNKPHLQKQVVEKLMSLMPTWDERFIAQLLS